jgi:hypothetical protein
MSRNWLTALVFGLAAAVLVGPASAQQEGRGRGRGFGFGGQQEQTLFSLVRNEAVQKEIGLADAAKVREIAEEFGSSIRSEMESAGISFQGLRDLPEAERAAKMREIQTKSAEVTKKVTDKLEPKLKEALTAEQLGRLKEIKVQAAGVAALSDAAVVKELGLSDEQQKKIAAIVSEAAAARRELMASAQGGNREEIGTKLREAAAATLTKATDVLDAGQKEKFASLKGKPFDVAQLGGRGGPGGQRGRRGNNDGNN